MKKIIEDIKNKLEEVMDEERGCNEGSLSMYYVDILNSLDYMKLIWIQFSREYVEMITPQRKEEE